MRWEIVTSSGSTYHLDDEARTIARVSGATAPTARTGAGEARRYAAATSPSFGPPAVGEPLLIWWGEHAATPAVDGAQPATITTPLVALRQMAAA